MKDNNIDISVVILTKNAQGNLERLLNRIFIQRFNGRFEVICVDSGSEDKTIEICKRYPLRLFRIKPTSFNHGLTRNFAISKAKGKYIILMSQDAVPSGENWMRKLIETMDKDERIAGVYSQQICEGHLDLLTKKYVNNYLAARNYKIVNFIEDKNRYQKFSPKEKYFFCNFDNVCSCIRKSVWKDFPFVATDFGEDIAWAKKILEAHYKIVYTPEVQVLHAHKKGLIHEYKRQYQNSKKLYELFSFGLASNLIKTIGLFLFYTLQDALFLLYNVKDLKEGVLFLKAPFLSLFSVAGQYRGIKEAKRNLNVGNENSSNSPQFPTLQ